MFGPPLFDERSVVTDVDEMIHEFEVFNPVVRFDAVLVVDILRLQEKAAEMFFHHETMLTNIAAFCAVWMRW